MQLVFGLFFGGLCFGGLDFFFFFWRGEGIGLGAFFCLVVLVCVFFLLRAHQVL